MNKKVIFGVAIAIIGFIFCFFYINQVMCYKLLNPGFTYLRCFLDNPKSTIGGLIFLVVAAIGTGIMIKGGEE